MAFSAIVLGRPLTTHSTLTLDTNIVTCELSVIRNPDLICFVTLQNKNTNSRIWGVRLPPEMLFTVDLVDAQERPAEKTEFGKKFGSILTQDEINHWFVPTREAHGTWAAGFFAPFGSADQKTAVNHFSIPLVFKLKQPGEYTLRLRTRLVQACVSDEKGTMRTNAFDAQYFGTDRSKPVRFEFIWMPEVRSKVNVTARDVNSQNLSK